MYSLFGRLIDRCVFLHPTNHNRVVSACCTTYKALQILWVLYWNMWNKNEYSRYIRMEFVMNREENWEGNLKHVSADCSPLSFKFCAKSRSQLIQEHDTPVNRQSKSFSRAGVGGLASLSHQCCWLCTRTIGLLRLTQQQQY